MKTLSAIAGRCASFSLIAVALAAAAGAQAAQTSFQFTNQESAVYAAGDTTDSLTGSAFGSTDDVGNAIPGSWVTSLTFNALLDPGTASGTWSFDDITNGNDLSGTFTATIANSSSGNISYTITGGDGMFAGATGMGTSTATLTDAFDGFADFSETGSMSVVTPVPEPSTMAMMFAGLLAVGYSARRRKV